MRRLKLEGREFKSRSRNNPYRPFPGAVCIGQLQPFVRDIMLVECAIASTSFRELQRVDPLLTIGSLLPLKREPANEHDALAIMIFDEQVRHLGYVPRAKNEALVCLMDAG